MHLKQSKQWGEYLKALGWRSKYIPQAVRIKKLLFWSVIKIQRPQKISAKFLDKVDALAKKNRALFVKIEPIDNKSGNLLLKHGYRKSKEPLSPTKTIIMDIKPPLDEILKKTSKDTRQKIKHLAKYSNASKIARLDNIEKLKEFYTLFSKTSKRKKFWIPSFKEIEKKARALKDAGFLITIYRKSAPATAAFILIEGTSAYYEHAARDSNLAGDIPYILFWEIIKECKKRKMTKLDFCGIYDDRFSRSMKGWKGFSIFKKKWGGEEVSYAKPYIKHYNMLSFALSNSSLF